MSSQKQCHRIRKNEDIKAQLIKQNSDLVTQNLRLKHELQQYEDVVAYYMSMPPIWRIFKYIKWRKNYDK